MSDPRLRVIKTELDNLVSNLRGEVGEIITTWTMLRFLMAEERRLSSNDIAKDMRNQDLAFISTLRHKMHDEIVARLSEFANAKIGRLTFHFASAKLKALQTEEESFRRFVQRHRFAPTVYPAPTAANMTRSPFFNRPASYASRVASGMVAAVVLPKRSILMMTLSQGNPRRSAAAVMMRRLA